MFHLGVVPPVPLAGTCLSLHLSIALVFYGMQSFLVSCHSKIFAKEETAHSLLRDVVCPLAYDATTSDLKCFRICEYDFQ